MGDKTVLEKTEEEEETLKDRQLKLMETAASRRPVAEEMLQLMVKRYKFKKYFTL